MRAPNPSSLVDGEWRAAGSQLVDGAVAASCGDPVAGLAVPDDHLVDVSTSTVERDDAHARTAVLAYDSAGAARAAARAIDPEAVERCLVTATNRYLADDDDGAEDAPAPPSPSSFQTELRPGPGDPATTLVVSTFEEDVIGGYDNTHAVAVVVTARGRLVIAAIAVGNSQNASAADYVPLARRLATATLAHALDG